MHEFKPSFEIVIGLAEIGMFLRVLATFVGVINFEASFNSVFSLMFMFLLSLDGDVFT